MKCNESRLLMHILLVIFFGFQLLITSRLESSNEETVIEGCFADFFICRSCGHDVSLSNFLLDKHSPLAIGTSNQTLAAGKQLAIQEVQNTLGIRFKIIVVQKAYCAKVESWSTLHSWFPGYAWKLCVCPKCRTHLGWMFEPTESATSERYFPSENGFYALIYSNIISEGYVNSLLMREKVLREN
ncbi:protein cereblon-like isoform X2 [Toxorhynchites rutilus septentrionalis]|uniref:protein cereblon-like isoform X2 n=1 Tax=Toxorhynchites rutilus septentrionalis TaxID=329112 RepID=UPI00247AAC8D|nr:protein cereblon-like isoform X2 [Toxorhynchites rutilus septentrionalis]